MYGINVHRGGFGGKEQYSGRDRAFVDEARTQALSFYSKALKINPDDDEYSFQQRILKPNRTA